MAAATAAAAAAVAAVAAAETERHGCCWRGPSSDYIVQNLPHSDQEVWSACFERDGIHGPEKHCASGVRRMGGERAADLAVATTAKPAVTDYRLPCVRPLNSASSLRGAASASARGSRSIIRWRAAVPVSTPNWSNFSITPSRIACCVSI